jgi:hypothetical protein
MGACGSELLGLTENTMNAVLLGMLFVQLKAALAFDS